MRDLGADPISLQHTLNSFLSMTTTQQSMRQDSAAGATAAGSEGALAASVEQRATPTAPAQEPVFADVLCAIDGTRASLAAVRMAVALAGERGHLTLMAATAPKGSGAYAGAVLGAKRAERVLEEAAQVAAQARVATTTQLEPSGPAPKVILERSREHDLIVIGEPAVSRLGELVIGGVTAAALSQFTTPLLSVRRSFGSSLHECPMLVASDGQPGSERAVEIAGRLAAAQHAPLSLVHALSSETAERPPALAAQRDALERATGGRVQELVEAGRPAELIFEAAQRMHASLAVVGSRRRRGLRTLGSVSRRVVHEAPCSVLLVPPALSTD